MSGSDVLPIRTARVTLQLPVAFQVPSTTPALPTTSPSRSAHAGFALEHSPLPTEANYPKSGISSRVSATSAAASSPGQAPRRRRHKPTASPHLSAFDAIAFRHSDTVLGDWRANLDELPPNFDGSLASIFAQSECEDDHTPNADDEDEAQKDKDLENQTGEKEPSQESVSERIRALCSHCLHCTGLRRRSPAFRAWLVSRIGTKTSVSLILSFMLLSAAKFVAEEGAYVSGVNFFSIGVVKNLASLLSSIIVTVFVEGFSAHKQVFSWQPLWRFSGIACLFSLADMLILCSRSTGSSSTHVVTVGYIFLPLATGLSFFVFGRKYGKLEWLTCGMMTLGILTFVFLREQSREVEQFIEAAEVDDRDPDRVPAVAPYNVCSMVLAIAAVFASVSASILAERIFKKHSIGLKSWTARFYIMKVHIDFTQLIVSALIWVVCKLLTGMPPQEGRRSFLSEVLMDWQQDGTWFGNWTSRQVLIVVLSVAQGWTAGLMVKEFSTVTRAIFQTLCFVFVMLTEDALLGGRFNFKGREVPSIMLTAIIVLAAIIFQTGRLNLKVIEQAAREAARPSLEDQQPSMKVIPASPGLSQPSTTSNTRTDDANSGTDFGADSAATDDEEDQLRLEGYSPILKVRQVEPPFELGDTSKRKSCYQKMCEQLRLYALMIVYIVADAIRNLTLAKALASVQVNPNSMNLVSYSMGIAMAVCLSLYLDGFRQMLTAWRWRKVMKFLPAGFMFAVSTTMMNMAYSAGMNAALALVLGKFYTPVAVVGARCANPKLVYMWIEYVALVILTLATIAFGYLQVFPLSGKSPPSTSSLLSMLLVLGAASAAALNSLLMERILKGEKDGFRIQKVRIDVSSILSTFVLIPLLGVISQNPLNVPWKLRPISGSCPKTSVCFQHDGCLNPACTCDCGSGLFAGWTQDATLFIMVALCINTGYGWLVGKLVQDFSTVHRAIADAFSLLLVYFVGDPLLNGSSLGNMSLNMVAFIVPLSAAIFAVAASEMRKVMEAALSLSKGLSNDLSASSSEETSTDESSSDHDPEHHPLTPKT